MAVEIFLSQRHGSRTLSRRPLRQPPRSSWRGYSRIQLKIALIEPADETFEDSNIFLKLVQRRHL